MKEFRGTPGPWFPFFGSTGTVVLNEDDEMVLSVSNAISTHSEKDANASLVAAAPELLEALQAALAWIDTVPQDAQLPTMPGFDRDWVDGIINKALGGSQ